MPFGLITALVCGGAGTPQTKTVRTYYDLATLTPGDAARLNGKRAVYRLAIASLPEKYEGQVLYDCETQDAVFRSVWLVGGQEVADVMTVEATLRVIHHPRTVGDMGTVFEVFTEYRLIRAVVLAREVQ